MRLDNSTAPPHTDQFHDIIGLFKEETVIGRPQPGRKKEWAEPGGLGVSHLTNPSGAIDFETQVRNPQAMLTFFSMIRKSQNYRTGGFESEFASLCKIQDCFLSQRRRLGELAQSRHQPTGFG